MTCTDYCEQCVLNYECGAYDREDIKKGRSFGKKVLCDDHIPQCECGELTWPGTQGQMCAECELKLTYDMAEKGELSQAEVFEAVHEIQQWQRGQEKAA